MHSGGLELIELTYTRFEDNLIRHRGDLQEDALCLVTTPSRDFLTPLEPQHPSLY